MNRPLALVPDPCRVCGDDRWMRLTGLSLGIFRDVPCPVCNRHPNLPPVEITAEIPRGLSA